MSNDVRYAIQHSFKKEVVIPIVALYHNFDFLYNERSETRLLKTSDGYICKVLDWELIHICKLENKIKELYNMDIWSYIKKWYNAMPNINSMYFLMLHLEKDEL